MTRAYNVIDADGHILEPLDLWDKYIDPEFRERRPRFVIDDNGKERLSVEGKLLGNPRGIGSLGSVGARQGIVKGGPDKKGETLAQVGQVKRFIHPSASAPPPLAKRSSRQ